MKRTVVIGFLGSSLDHTGKGPKRWERWRPTVSLFQHEDFLVDRLELLYQKEYASLLQTITADISAISPETEVVPRLVDISNPWDFEEVFETLHDFTSCYTFRQDEEYLIHITTGSHVAQICLFLLTEARYFPARLIQSGPGRGRKASTRGSRTIIDLDLSRYDRIANRFARETENDISFLKSGIHTKNKRFNRLMERVEKVAVKSTDPILLAGPTGAGKSRLARKIYELKKSRNRISGECVEVNCATLKGENGMAALFGHTTGAFTGAVNERPGLLKSADRGLLFLDEIGELGLDEQAMLLRAIELKSFLPVGADQETQSDFQLICGSNRDLKRESSQGRFRQDLLARINLWTFSLPGLRERTEDIEPNFDYELERFRSKSGRNISINSEARKRFLDFAVSEKATWSANFRDLSGAVTRMATLAEGDRITPDVVREEIDRLTTAWDSSGTTPHPPGILENLLGRHETIELDLFDRITLEGVIDICRGSSSLADAGRHLFNRSRQKRSTSNDSDRLRKYLKKFGLDYHMIRNLTGTDQ